MPKGSVAIAASVLIAGLPFAPAYAWFHGYSGGGFSRGGDWGGWNHASSFGAGGYSHSSDWGGWDHSTQVTSSGVAHESNYGGAWHGTAATPEGSYHASDYGGYYHGTAGYYGHTTTTAYGAYYHQPSTVNYYGAGCYNCGYNGWGAAAAGAAVGAATGLAVGAAAGSAATAAAYAAPPAYVAALPAGCFYQAPYQEYQCGSTWYRPAYGANGVYYQYVAAP